MISLRMQWKNKAQLDNQLNVRSENVAQNTILEYK